MWGEIGVCVCICVAILYVAILIMCGMNECNNYIDHFWLLHFRNIDIGFQSIYSDEVSSQLVQIATGGSNEWFVYIQGSAG